VNVTPPLVRPLVLSATPFKLRAWNAAKLQVIMGDLVPKFAWAAAGIDATADTSNATRIAAGFRDFIKFPPSFSLWGGC
jgi:hypothetical protein